MQKDLPINKQILAVTHTARNVGDRPEQIVWYRQDDLDADGNMEVSAKVFTTETGDWDELMTQAIGWLNANVAPH